VCLYVCVRMCVCVFVYVWVCVCVYVCVCVSHINQHGVTQAQEIFTILQRTDRLVRDKDMSGPIMRIKCYGDGHLRCETVLETRFDRAVGGWHTRRHHLVVKSVSGRRSEDCARSRPAGRRTVFHGTYWCTRRGQVRADQGEAPAERQLIASLFSNVLPLSDLQVGCDETLSAYIAGTRQNVPQIRWHAIIVAATTVVLGQKCLNRNEYI
jgi:hypothetical protein